MDRRGRVRLWVFGTLVVLAGVGLGFVFQPGPQNPVPDTDSVPIEAAISSPVATSPVVDSRRQEVVVSEDGDPVVWVALLGSPLEPRFGHSGVWTGDEVIFWGGLGRNEEGEQEYASDGAAYSPADDSWRLLSDAPVGNVFFHQAVWTGSEMLVFGGLGELSQSGGAAYSPKTDTWRKLSQLKGWGNPAPTGVWTGAELIVWGGNASGGPKGAYDPETDSWRSISSPPSGGRSGHSALWTGTEMLIFGGTLDSYDLESDPYRETPRSSNYSSDGLGYDPVLDSWRSIPSAPISKRGWHTAVWTGTQMVVWGGSSGDHLYSSLSDGAAYDPVFDSWSALPPSPLAPRSGHLAVWTDLGMLIWGGGKASYGPTDWYADGAIWDATTGAWYQIPPSDSLVGLFGVRPVWAEDQLLYWGQFEQQGGPAVEVLHSVGERITPTVAGASPHTSNCQLPTQKPPISMAGEAVISLLFHCGGGDFPDVSTTVYRIVRVDDLTGTSELVVRTLLEGPTLAEREAGVISAFGNATAEALIESTRIGISTHPEWTNGAGFNFDPSIFAITNNVFGEGVLFQAELFANLFQDPDVDLVRFRLEGSCVDWPEYLASVGCQHVTRQQWQDLKAQWSDR